MAYCSLAAIGIGSLFDPFSGSKLSCPGQRRNSNVRFCRRLLHLIQETPEGCVTEGLDSRYWLWRSLSERKGINKDA
jgi:hypothetical protein